MARTVLLVYLVSIAKRKVNTSEEHNYLGAIVVGVIGPKYVPVLKHKVFCQATNSLGGNMRIMIFEGEDGEPNNVLVKRPFVPNML
jgi:hypothetical protein